MMADRKTIAFFFFCLLCLSANFLHADFVWSIPATISTSTLNASDPQVVIDPNGNATAVWVENNLVKASTHPLNGSWSTPTTISNLLNTASTPRLGVDSSGNVTATWLENSLLTTGVVNSAMMTSGGSWGVGLPISSATGGASAPSLAVDSSGNAVAVWVSGGVIQSNSRSSGIWGATSTAISGSNSDSPQVAISVNGTVIAVWHSLISGADVIRSATKTIGGNWNSAISVFTVTAALKHGYPKVAIDPNGNAQLVWFRYNIVNNAYVNVNVLSSTLPFNSTSWATPTIVSNAGMRNPADLTLKVIVDANGDTIAFWTNSYDGQTFWLENAIMRFGGSWGYSVQSNYPSLYSLGADMAVNTIGDVLSAYMIWDGILLSIYSQESDIATPVSFGFWSFPNNISLGSDNGYPKCAQTLIGNASNAAVIWLNFNGSHTVIQASTGSKNELLPPTNLNVVQNVANRGVYQDYYNTVSWLPSSSSNIIQYNVYRNGVFFTGTDAATFQIVDHNTSQNGSVTYAVAAMNNSYSQSPMATVNFP